MATCEVCRSPSPDRVRPGPRDATDRILLSREGLNQVRVKGFCTQRCLDTFVAGLVSSATCAWCGKPLRGAATRAGPMHEPYCSEKCHTQAGHAYYTYYRSQILGE